MSLEMCYGKATNAKIKSLAKIVKRVFGVMEVLQISCRRRKY